jgi:hypothetical protein
VPNNVGNVFWACRTFACYQRKSKKLRTYYLGPNSRFLAALFDPELRLIRKLGL